MWRDQALLVLTSRRWSVKVRQLREQKARCETLVTARENMASIRHNKRHRNMEIVSRIGLIDSRTKTSLGNRPHICISILKRAEAMRCYVSVVIALQQRWPPLCTIQNLANRCPNCAHVIIYRWSGYVNGYPTSPATLTRHWRVFSRRALPGMISPSPRR